MSLDTHSKSGITNKFWAVAAVLGVVVVLVLVGIRLLQGDDAKVALGEKPKDFILTPYFGERINTSELRGKVVLINFWSSWCTTCDDESVLLEEAWQRYQSMGTEEIAFLGIAYMDTEPAALAFLAEYGVTYPNGPDLGSAISKIYQVNTVPETFLLDREGTLRYVKFGPFISINEIISAVDFVLMSGSD